MSFIFDENDLLYILEEFERHRISPRESAENGRNAAHGLNCKISVNSEVILEIHDEKYPMKKISILNFKVSFTFVDPKAREYLKIDEVTGEIYLLKDFDFEKKQK